MNSKKSIAVGVSAALIELKAELHRKQGELQASRSQNLGVPKSLKVKNEPMQEKLSSGKNRGIDKRVAKDSEETKLEEKTYERAKSVLEAKAKLYDEMHSNALRYDEKEHPVLVNSLVDFQRKAIDRINEDRLTGHSAADGSSFELDEEWTEFTDSLGRVRRCLKTDLADFQARDNELTPAPMSVEEKARLMKHEQWDKEVEEIAHKSNVHYQDILFDEIRGHGVGYYGFAKDDEKRAEQLHELKKLSQQTEASREKVQKERSKKKLELKERLRKLRARKRAKMGLPPVEEKDSSSSEDEKPLFEEPLKSEEMKPAEEPETRPWDFGKAGVFGPKPVNFDELDAKWLKNRREDRKAEFAPPSLYTQPSTSSDAKYQNFVKSAAASAPPQQVQRPRVYEPIPQPPPQLSRPIQDEVTAPAPDASEDWKRGTGSEVAPPPTYDYYHGDTGRRAPKIARSDDASISEAIAQGVRAFREKFEEERKAKGTPARQNYYQE